MSASPLADQIRPKDLEEFFGQEKLIGPNSFLRKAIKNDNVPSMIFWGPPGSGKTTLAHIFANLTKSDFIKLSAVTSGKKDLLTIIERAKENRQLDTKTILFIDEIHRWNKAQQDALLPFVENGLIILIGATTENPSFEVIGALVSRSRIFVLEKLSDEDIKKIIQRAAKIFNRNIKINKKAINLLSRLSNGDARMAINTLEAAASQNKNISPDLIKEILQKTHLLYDKGGEEHYNIISALHKSMRGGDADASLYWLARMLSGGEDPLYIARRLVRFASEDIGLANNTALILANAVFDTCHKLGMPECGVHLAQCVIYLAKSKKDVTAYLAYGKAQKDVERYGNLPVPFHIRNAPSKLMKELGYGKNYKYTPLEDSSDQTYFPEKLKNRKYINRPRKA
ncbi:MAG TPA: replication-associated recombination protein A [Patescibacteria group bacterium]|nr:replication-associated recombination protein A [Patescibacteria group bacterium]